MSFALLRPPIVIDSLRQCCSLFSLNPFCALDTYNMDIVKGLTSRDRIGIAFWRKSLTSDMELSSFPDLLAFLLFRTPTSFFPSFAIGESSVTCFSLKEFLGPFAESWIPMTYPPNLDCWWQEAENSSPVLRSSHHRDSDAVPTFCFESCYTLDSPEVKLNEMPTFALDPNFLTFRVTGNG